MAPQKLNGVEEDTYLMYSKIDKTIKEIEQNATNQFLDPTQQAIGEISK